MTVAGVLLAAGAGRRMGGPKALLRHPDGTPWVARAAGVLAAGGCSPVLVVLGAGAEQAQPLVPPQHRVVLAGDWRSGMSASLRAGLAALAPEAAEGALIGLVDTPDVSAGVVARLVALSAPDVLARACYQGFPGHPVLLGRAHWAAVAAGARGDAGARDYLATHAVRLVECGELGSGRDIDLPDLP